MFEHLDKGVLTRIIEEMDLMNGIAPLVLVGALVRHPPPPEFLEFMKTDQAVYPYINHFPIPPKDGDGILRFLNWKKMEDKYAMVNEAMQEHFNIENPPSLLPLAETEGGNYVCLCVDEDKENYGAIYFWDHEGAIVKLTDSFPEFLATVEYEPEWEARLKAEKVAKQQADAEKPIP